MEILKCGRIGLQGSLFGRVLVVKRMHAQKHGMKMIMWYFRGRKKLGRVDISGIASNGR